MRGYLTLCVGFLFELDVVNRLFIVRGLCEVETTSCVDHVLEVMLLNVSLIVYGEQLVNICVELIFGD